MYVFPNAAPQAADRLRALADVFDPGTVRHLEARGVARGWSCLEVGGGLGTMTRWLASRVGPLGQVLATDIDTRHLERIRLPNVRVQRHDITTDPLPAASFDLACARLVLEHLPDPDLALARMAAAVKPGGWVLVEDFDILLEPAGAISKTASAMRRVTVEAGVRREFGRTLLRRLRAAGLVDAGTEGRAFIWPGGSAGAALSRLNFEQLRAPILATGLLTEQEFTADLARLEEDGTEIHSPVLWTAWGRRPLQ